LPAAIAHFQAAVAKAPEFAAGWSSLSLAEEVTFWYVTMTPAEQTDALAREAAAAERAAALEPGAAATEHALGNVARSQFKFALAEGHYLRGMQIDPGYPDVREDYAELLYEVGRVEDSAVAARQLVQLDPYFGVGWIRLWDAANALDRREEVAEAVRQIRAINPANWAGKFGLLDYALNHGRVDEARAALAEIEKNLPEDAGAARQLLAWVLHEPGTDEATVRAALPNELGNQAGVYLIARQDIDGYNADIQSRGAVLMAYYFANLYSSKPAGHAMLRDPRVKEIVARLGFPAYWREKGWPGGCRAVGDADFECGVAATP
jgi:tetratricopeptide (TPR) repeat protein